MKYPNGEELWRAQPERAVCGIRGTFVEERSGPLRSRRRRRRDECGRNFSESIVMGLLLPGRLRAGGPVAT